MNILISNDDGVDSVGIKALKQELSKIAQVWVLAPEKNRSAASSSLSLVNALRPKLLENGDYSLNGTPADCVHVALNGFLDVAFDLVVSGINVGANLGDDVIYSGTVAAAMEGRHLPLTSIAISLNGRTHFETAARVALDVVSQIDRINTSAREILNINVPDVPYNQIRGFKVCSLGYRGQSSRIYANVDPRGEKYYWIGSPGLPKASEQEDDFSLIAQNYVTITPVSTDMTAYGLMSKLEHWVQSSDF